MTLFSLNYDGTGSATKDGFELRAHTRPDEGHEPPWEAEDGHGPVREARANFTGYISKNPGEVVIGGDSFSMRGNARAWVYDFAEACKIARAEGWDAEPCNTDKRETPRKQAEKAARADMERLRQWLNGDWYYLGVIVDAYRNGLKLGSASLWGIESDADDYLQEVADELADEAIENAKAKLAELCECAEASA